MNLASSYNSMPPAIKGMKADTAVDHVVTRSAVGAVPFGVALAEADVTASNRSVKTLTGVSDKFVGFSVHTHTDNPTYLDSDLVNAMKIGQLWVETTESVNAEDSVYVNIADGKGNVCKTSAGNVATGAKFVNPVIGAGLALIAIVNA